MSKICPRCINTRVFFEDFDRGEARDGYFQCMDCDFRYSEDEYNDEGLRYPKSDIQKNIKRRLTTEGNKTTY